MRKLLFLLPIMLLFPTGLMSQNNFYDIETVGEIKIYFDENNWDHILDSLFQTGDGSGRLIGQLTINGENYDSVGIRYKGYSSWNVDSIKNPFNIKLDYIIDGQNHYGYSKLKLSNVIHDPTFIREALSYKIARKYMPAAKANFSNVFINNTLIGIYTSVEFVGKDFIKSHFGSKENAFFKGSPEHLEIPFGQNANLSNIHGTDTADYYAYYDIKSDYGWTELYELIRILNDSPDSIESILDVDRALWMHAFNYSLLNLDSYIGYAQNYYIYKDNNNRFNTILWDLNMSFGSFRLTDGIIPSQLPIGYLTSLDPLQHTSSIHRPLISSLLQNNTYKRMFLAHIRTIMEENFVNNNYVLDGLAMQSIIDQDVLNDPNRFYSYDDFKDNFDTTVTSGSLTYPGIVSLMNDRTNYLSTYPGYQNAPVITNLNSSPTNLVLNTNVWLTAEISGSDTAFLAYRYNYRDIFKRVSMFDDGNHQDGIAGDNIFGASVYYSSDFQYYIYAENNDAGIFSPKRAEYEYYEISGTSNKQVVINEIMASNYSTQADEKGDYDDWIELYNNSDSIIDLSGHYLTDDVNSLTKWAFPDTSINPGNYLIIWADNEPDEGALHTNFKLSASGEDVYLISPTLSILNEVIFPNQTNDMAYARVPNGIGSFNIQTPTFSFNNDSLNSADLISYNVYPNPTSGKITIQGKHIGSIQVFNIYGQIFEEIDVNSDATSINLEDLSSGIYFLKISTYNGFAVSKVIME